MQGEARDESSRPAADTVPPADADRAKEDLPFVFPAAAAGQCQREFIGVNSLDRDDRGVMHY